MTPEGRVKKDVIEYLRKRGHWVLPHQTTAIFDSRMGRYRAFNPNSGTLGEPDLLVFSKSSPISPIWLELKAKNGKLSPQQIIFFERAKLWGHEVAVVRSVEDCKKLGL